jgi:hypothetical protein
MLSLPSAFVMMGGWLSSITSSISLDQTKLTTCHGTLAKDMLKNTAYNGDQRHWDFERYINVHTQQHSITEGLVRHEYTGIDPQSKVRFLLNSIKFDKFDAVKTRIMSDERLLSNFGACGTLYQDFIRQTSKSRTSSAMVTTSEVKVGGKRKASGAVEDRYCTKEKYND